MHFQTNQFFRTLLLVSVLIVSLPSCTAKKKVTGTTKTDKGISREENILRTSAVEYAKELKGSKYKYAGRSPKTGFDCSGFTCYVLSKFNVTVSPGSKVQATEGKPVDLKKVKQGDLIFFSKSGKDGKVTHVAMVVENTEEGIVVVHSTSSRGVIVENITTSDYWRPKILYARDVISGRK